ncbi:hypothetical protein [Microvirga tunisiensis]|uniref:Uncharacterized protein n=1 Tax=Microvirga tunisiensis TaxID=2108360 RepID=A0A5N7MWA9_9HYPH|nr:hypothetical protein [Microvirga tunisiensis]MPR31265.1 hypothetical protein [Microvirga tunisiensis]
MRTGYGRVFAISLVLGWSAPDLTQPNLGLAAQARAKAHAQKAVKKRHQTVQKRAVQKRVASKAAIKRSAPPVRFAMADQQPQSSSLSPSSDVPIPPDMVSPPPELHAPTPEEQMEKLRVGLEKLARTYPSPEAHMEALRLGLERLAKTMNEGES